MTDHPPSQNWWQTLPGMLTAAAAILTAITGLLATLFQYGIIGRNDANEVRDGDVSTISSPSNLPSEPGHLAPWPKSSVVLTTRDGAVTTLRAETLSNCISVSHELTLESGQEIPFEKLKSFEVLRVDPIGAPNAKATLGITLLDGRTLQDSVGAGCDIFGYNDLGRFNTTFQQLKQVEFKR
jgi:hypothetical protein